MRLKNFMTFFVAFALVIILFNAIFIVKETEQVLIFQFGEIKKVHQTPGLKIKIPFIQEAAFLERRIIDYERPSFNITLRDQKRIVVDVYALYRIKDPLLFFKSVGDERMARSRLDEIIPGTLKAVFGGFSLTEIISDQRSKTMEKLLTEVNKSAQSLGIEVVDARIRRSDLPPKNSQAIFARMKSERQRAAKEIRAQGEELGQEIRSTADKERAIILAEAEKNAKLIHGQAEAKALQILSAATHKDIKFYEIYRTLEAYRKALVAENTTFILSPKNSFFKHFNVGTPGMGARTHD